MREGTGLKNLAGSQIGRWHVQDRAPDFIMQRPDRVRKLVIWNCVCECGTERSVRAHNLLSGLTQSCGCLQRERMRQYNATKRQDVVRQGN